MSAVTRWEGFEEKLESRYSGVACAEWAALGSNEEKKGDHQKRLGGGVRNLGGLELYYGTSYLLVSSEIVVSSLA